MARRGRPPYPASRRRTHKTLVSLTTEELALIRRAAAGAPIAVWIRNVALRTARRRHFAAARDWQLAEALVVPEAGVSGASRHNRPRLLDLIARCACMDRD